jgi:hypothetical protein
MRFQVGRPGKPSPRSVRLRLAAVAAVAGLLLSGCAQTTPDAVRVGDVTVDEAQIDAIAAPYEASLAEAGIANTQGDLRQAVAEAEIFREVARRYAAEKGIKPNDPDYATTAQQLQTTVDDPFARLTAEANAYLTALVAGTPGRTPTDEEMRDVFNRFVAIAGPVATYDDIRGELLQRPDYASALALRDELVKAADRYGVTVSPRYQPLQFTLNNVQVAASGQNLVLVSLPLGQQGTGAVRSAG